MRIVDQKNFAAGLLYVALGGAVAIAALGFQVGTAARMGPGYFPLMVGVALIVTGLVVLFGAIGAEGERTARIGRWDLRAVLAITLAVAAFALLIRPLGLIVTVPAVILLSAFADRQRAWRNVLVAIAVLLPLTWLIFIVILGLQLRLLPTFVG
jgi:hypothetical protein